MTQDTSSTQVDPQTSPPGSGETASEQEFPTLTLRRDQLYAELSRLEQEDPEVRQVLGTFIGNKASRQYQPQIRERDTTIAQLRQDLFRAEVKSMDEKAIEDKVSSDREWGKQYIDYVHAQRNGQTQTQPIDDRPLVEAAMAEILDYGRRNGLSDADWNKFVAKAQTGAYGNEHWQIGLTRMQQDVADFVRNGRAGEVKLSVQKTNPALAKGGPDITAGNRTGTSAVIPATAKEFNALPVAEQRALIASYRDEITKLR